MAYGVIVAVLDVAHSMYRPAGEVVTVRRGESAEADGCGGLPAAVAGQCKLQHHCFTGTARPCCMHGGSFELASLLRVKFSVCATYKELLNTLRCHVSALSSVAEATMQHVKGNLLTLIRLACSTFQRMYRGRSNGCIGFLRSCIQMITIA